MGLANDDFQPKPYSRNGMPIGAKFDLLDALVSRFPVIGGLTLWLNSKAALTQGKWGRGSFCKLVVNHKKERPKKDPRPLQRYWSVIAPGPPADQRDIVKREGPGTVDDHTSIRVRRNGYIS